MPLRRFGSLILLLMTGFCVLAQAQDEPKPPEPAAAAAAAAEEFPPAREQTIYIPYTKLRGIFEQQGRGVFVPYEEFQRLWKAARQATRPADDAKPPVTALISEIDSQATVSRDVMNVVAKLQIEVLTDGWHYIHLRLDDAAIHSARFGDKPARLVYEAGKGYWVLVEKHGNQAEKMDLALEYSKAFAKEPGTNRVEFQAPQAPVNRWQIRLPDPGVKVNVHPNVSATDAGAESMLPDEPAEEPNEEPKPGEEPPPATLVQAFVGAADKVRIDWTAKAEGAAGLAALVTVEARQEVTIDEGVIRTRVNLAYDIERADVTQLTVDVPADQNVVNVFDANMQKWVRKTEGQTQTLTIDLFQPTRGTQNVLIELERFAGDREMPEEMMHAEVQAPVVRALQAGTAGALVNVGRQQGVVVVRLGQALRGEATARTGLVQIDAPELPAPLAGQDWAFAYRYAALPFDLTLNVEKLQPQIEVEELVEVYVEPNQITADLLAILNIERAGVFQLELQVPEDYEIRIVQGRAAAGAAAAEVESHVVDEVEFVPDPTMPEVKATRRTKLLVNLSRRAMGRVGLWVELVKRQEDNNLLQPMGAISVVSLPVPRVQPARVYRTTGRVLVYAPESLRINPKEASGLRAISPSEALSNMESTRAGRFHQLRELVAYAYTQEPVSLAVEAERRKPYIEARQLLAAHIESGVVRYESTFFFDIRYSSVRSLRIDVPAPIAADMRNLTPQLREQRIEPQPQDVAQNYVAWQLAGEGELLGNVVSRFTWEKKIGELPVGQAVPIDLPQFKVGGVDRFWGQIVASKAETIEITVAGEPQGLRGIDPQRDLMSGASNLVAARAFEFHDDWSIELTATRYELEEVKRTSIDRAFVRMVVTRGDQIAVQALYRLRSARQRVAVILPGVDPVNTAQSLDSQPLRINGASAPLEHDATQFYIPLTGHAADEPLLVELRYTITGGPSRLVPPEFPEDPAMQQVYLATYLPQEWKVLAARGPWTDESTTNWIDQAWRTEGPEDSAILWQLRDGIANCSTTGDDFALDGRRHLFSTLRPAGGDAGALRLWTAHRNTVNGAVFLLVAVVGIAIAPLPIGTRLMGMAGLLVAVVLAAVFAPTFAHAILGPPLYVAIGLVLVVWLARCLAWLVPRLFDWLDDRFRKAAAATTLAAAAATLSPPLTEAMPTRQEGESPFAGPADVETNGTDEESNEQGGQRHG